MMRKSQALVLAGAAAAVLAVAGLTFADMAVRTPINGPGGPRLDIALRSAPERPPVEGGVLEVGGLVDGYVHRPAPPPMNEDPLMIDAYLPEGADPWADEPVYAPGPVPAVAPIPPPQPVPPVAVGPAATTAPGRLLSFGFDAPRPDYAAERAARVAQLEARLETARTAEARAEAAEIFY